MQILIDTDRNISPTGKLTEKAELAVRTAVGRFETRITRVQVHLSDENSSKGGINDKRCVLEARPSGLDAVAVHHQAATVQLAIDGASEKLRSTLETLFGRLDSTRAGDVAPGA